MSNPGSSSSPSPAQLRVLTSLVSLCEYGVSPPLKVVAVESGLSPRCHGTVLRAYRILQQQGYVEFKLGCWRPTVQGLSLMREESHV